MHGGRSDLGERFLEELTARSVKNAKLLSELLRGMFLRISGPGDPASLACQVMSLSVTEALEVRASASASASARSVTSRKRW
jgi:hypothetical protein